MLTLFTRPGCKSCASLKAWLDKQGIRYEEVDADLPDAQYILRHHNAGQVAVPALMRRGHILVGFQGGERERKWLETLEDDDD